MAQKIKNFFRNIIKTLKKERRTCEDYSWNNVATLITNIMALTVYCSISPAIAEYQGKKTIFNFAIGAILVMGVILLCEIYHLIKWRGYDYLSKGNECLEKFSKYKLQIFPMILLLLFIISFGIHYYNQSTVECYASVREVYGIPEGTGKPLGKEEQKYRASYWEIETFKHKKRMVLTYVEPYQQLEFMQKKSTAYNIGLFQPSSKIVYDFEVDKEYYFSKDQNTVNNAEEKNFWVVKNISYYNSSGKLLLEMKRNKQNKLEIMTYSSDDMPQLLNSTLLRVSDEQAIENGILQQQVDTVYNSDGLPQMRRLASNVNNPYGVNGECYDYDQEKRLAALYYINSNGETICNKSGIMRITFQYNSEGNIEWIRYYSDEKGVEKIEGYYGVCSECLTYNEKGNLIERKQLDRSGRPWYDMNGVSIYQYEYEVESGRLIKEIYLDHVREPIRDKNNYCYSLEFGIQEEGESKEITISFDRGDIFKEEMAAEGEAHGFEQGQNEIYRFFDEVKKRSQEVLDKDELQIKRMDDTKDIQVNEADSGYNDQAEGVDNQDYFQSGIADSLYGSNNKKDQEIDFIRNYTDVCYTFDEHNRITDESYYKNGELVVNEDGYVRMQYKYDGQHRIKSKTYLDGEGHFCNLRDGYAKIEYRYTSGQDSELKGIKYLDDSGQSTINNKLGYAYVEYDRQLLGRQKRIVKKYYDSSAAATRKLICLPDLGYAVVEQLYDENGLLLQENYRDESEVLTSRKDYGVAEILYDYAEDGNLTCIQYKDTQGKPANRKDRGYAVVNQKYEAGRLQERWYEGYQNHMLKAVPDRKTGCAKIRYTYDNGRKTKEQYFDTKDISVLRKDTGCASWGYEYNDRGELAGQYFYDTEDHLILRSDTGYASVKYEYDKDGRCVFERFYGVEEKPIISTKYHCAGFQYNYDDRGNQTDTWYFGIDDKKIIRSDLGYAHVKSHYDIFGNEDIVEYYDDSEEEKLIERREGGYAKLLKSYDDGYIKKIEYRDANDQPVLRNDEGCAVVEYEYDEFGRKKAELYKGLKGEYIVNTKEHCAGYRYDYGEDGDWRNKCYIGLDGEPMIRKDYGFVQVRTENVEDIKRVSYLDNEKHPAIWRDGGFSSFEDIYENGNLVEERYFDKQQKPIIRSDLGFAVEKYQYDEYGKCVSDCFYDAEGEAIVSTEYHCAGFKYAYDENGNKTDIWYLGADGEEMIRPDLGFAHTHLKYDDLGNEIRADYYDINGDLIERKEGGYAYCEKDYENGDWIESRYFDADGKLVLKNDGGYAIVKNEYEEHKLISQRYYDTEEKPVISTKYHCAGFQYEYDYFGNRQDLWCIGVDGKWVVCEDEGYAHAKYEYDALGRKERTTYFDVDDNPVISKENHCAGFQYAYNGFGDYTDIWYIGLDGEEKYMIREDLGCAHIEYEYDDFGLEIKESYYNINEEPVISPEYHCAGYQYKYDENGNQTDIWYLGEDKNPMVRRDLGYAHVKYEYDDFGKKRRADFFDAKERRTIQKDNKCASWTNTYENGYWKEREYFDFQNEWMLMVDGYAIIRNEYNRCNQLVRQSYYDINDNPVINSKYHCASLEYEYDEKGDQINIWYLDTDGYLIVCEDSGCAHIQYEYDDFGNNIQESYYDEEEMPVISSEYYCAGMCYKYDTRGNQTDIWYLGIDGKSMVREDLGYAHVHCKYDISGNLIQENYYDENEEAVFGIEDYCAGYKYAYDANGNKTDTWFLGLEEEVIVREDLGYAHIDSEYDDFGNEEKIYYRDENEELAVHLGRGYAYCENEYKNGNCIESRYYDTQGHLVLWRDEGYAVIKKKYDKYGQCVSEFYYDEAGEPVISEKYQCACTRYVYDINGNNIHIYYYGGDGKLINRKDYGTACIKKYYDSYYHVTKEEYYNAKLDLVVRKDLGYAAVWNLYEGTHWLGTKYLDEDRELTINNKKGYAWMKREYDLEGRLVSKTFLDAGEQPINCEEGSGYAKIEWIYDSDGEIEDYRYIDQQDIEKV